MVSELLRMCERGSTRNTERARMSVERAGRGRGHGAELACHPAAIILYLNVFYKINYSSRRRYADSVIIVD